MGLRATWVQAWVVAGMLLSFGDGLTGASAQTAAAGTQAAQQSAQSATTTPGSKRPVDVVKPPTKDDLLRGAYGPYRANNDLLFYRLKLRVDPETKSIAGSNVVRFRMLEDGQKIQLELTPELTLDGIAFEGKALTYTRQERSLFIELGRVVKAGEVAEVTVAYHGRPVTQGRFGCFSFDKDKEGKPWITTACEGEGASVWWPNKDQWRDEPQDGMEMDIAVPDGLMDVSNGRFVASKDLGDGYTEWQWRVHYPINNYDVALNVGEYQHWSGVHLNKEVGAAGKTQIPFGNDEQKSETQIPFGNDKQKSETQIPFGNDKEKSETQIPFGNDKEKSGVQIAFGNDKQKSETQIPFGNDKQKSGTQIPSGNDKRRSGVQIPFGNDNTKDAEGVTTLDFYALPEDLEKAKVQFAQVPEMLDAYEHYFGEYPFDKDGYKLIEVPYAGMEHQSAVAYGNHFTNGYYGRDWTGVGISPKFDFIIIHESGHEWFGNAVTAADVSDMWIHEGWTTYLEVLYVEYRWGKADALRYVNGLKPKVHNELPMITQHDVNAEPPQDQYFKGALMLNTLRSVIDDDAKWFADIHDFYRAFQYKNIMTEDVVAWWSSRTGMELKPFFDEYLRHAKLPVLEVRFDAAKGMAEYRWKADEAGFAMPIEVGDSAHWTKVVPVTTAWQSMPWTGTAEGFAVATDSYYVNVVKE